MKLKHYTKYIGCIAIFVCIVLICLNVNNINNTENKQIIQDKPQYIIYNPNINEKSDSNVTRATTPDNTTLEPMPYVHAPITVCPLK